MKASLSTAAAATAAAATAVATAAATAAARYSEHRVLRPKNSTQCYVSYIETAVTF